MTPLYLVSKEPHWLELFQLRDILAAKAALETGEHGRCKTIS